MLTASRAAVLTVVAIATGSAPSRMGNRHPTIVPYETFPAADGEFVLAVGNDDQWRRLCEAAEIDDATRTVIKSQPLKMLKEFAK